MRARLAVIGQLWRDLQITPGTGCNVLAIVPPLLFDDGGRALTRTKKRFWRSLRRFEHWRVVRRGGDLAQIALSMGISKNAVENNRLLNAVELARIKELSGSRSDRRMVAREARVIFWNSVRTRCGDFQ